MLNENKNVSGYRKSRANTKARAPYREALTLYLLKYERRCRF